MEWWQDVGCLVVAVCFFHLLVHHCFTNFMMVDGFLRFASCWHKSSISATMK